MIENVVEKLPVVPSTIVAVTVIRIVCDPASAKFELTAVKSN